MLTFKIENETDLHVKVVSFLKERYPHSIFNAGLGENQDSVSKRINSFIKGYLRRSFDLIVHNLHKHYTGFVIEFKSPKGNGVLSPNQSICCDNIKAMVSRLSFPMTTSTQSSN